MPPNRRRETASTRQDRGLTGKVAGTLRVPASAPVKAFE